MADIIKYIRKEDKTPIGVVIATDKNNIGFSVCSPHDKWDRKIAKVIARGRANKPYPIQRRVLVSDEVYALLKPVLDDVRLRAGKYFQ